MKQKLITRLVLASLAGAAAFSAQAGQIQASSVSIAREVITTDTQKVAAPSISYRFAGDVDARVQAQTFQVQFTLESGEWSTDTADTPLLADFSLTDGVSGTVYGGTVTLDKSGFSTDKKTLYATFTVAQGAAALVKQPIISLNAAAGANKAKVVGLKTVVGDVTADNTGTCASTKSARMNIKHFVGLANPTAIADGASNGTADEHVRSGATNAATIMTFPTNIGVKFAASTGSMKLAAGGSKFFDGSAAGAVAHTAIAAGVVTPGTAHIGATATETIARLGVVHLVQNASGYDSNLTDVYSLADASATSVGTAFVGTATTNTGEVEAKNLSVAVSASNGFVVGGSVYATTLANNCAAGSALGAVSVTAANAAGPITLSLNSAALFGASGTNPVQICYSVPVANTVSIPSSSFTAVGTLTKADAGAGFNEQNNVCNGSLFSLGGGIKIDVRNYASSAETSGYQSVIRVINNSDSTTADVWAQVIHQDGKLGNYGKLGDLSPRAVMNLTAAQIDAALTTASTAPAANTGAAKPAAGTQAPRLRITSSNGSSLRVQNYLFNSATGQILEGSNAQGVDYDATAGRVGQVDQAISQDANSGLNLK